MVPGRLCQLFEQRQSSGTKVYRGHTVINVPETADHMEELARVNSQFHVSATTSSQAAMSVEPIPQRHLSGAKAVGPLYRCGALLYGRVTPRLG